MSTWICKIRYTASISTTFSSWLRIHLDFWTWRNSRRAWKMTEMSTLFQFVTDWAKRTIIEASKTWTSLLDLRLWVPETKSRKSRLSKGSETTRHVDNSIHRTHQFQADLSGGGIVINTSTVCGRNFNGIIFKFTGEHSYKPGTAIVFRASRIVDRVWWFYSLRLVVSFRTSFFPPSWSQNTNRKTCQTAKNRIVRMKTGRLDFIKFPTTSPTF